MTDDFPLYLANEPERPNADLEVRNKYSGEVVARTALADDALIDRAIAAARAASLPMRKLPAYARQEVLRHCVERFGERFDELADSLSVEAGKPIRDARGEVTRLIDTFRYASEESVRMGGEVLEMAISERARGRRGMTRRVPIGPCSFISPFNFPLNLVAHKIAPAIAVGCPFVLKPASQTPLGALIIGEILSETDLPKGAFSILPTPRAHAERFTSDERLKLLSFTGSPGVGWDLKARAGKKKVILELGGNAAVVVDETADLDDAAAQIITGAFYQSGQSCISVQRILIHDQVYERVKGDLIARTEKLKAGDPRDEDTVIGPIISEKEAERIERWIERALAAGARLLCGGGREGVMVQPTLLENVSPDCEVVKEEVFGPVAVLSRFSDFDAALREVDASRYGLQAGIFTRDLERAFKAWDALEVGGVMIGDVPSFRVDHMPYGGVKDSGLGREGIRYAMEDMTEIRLMVIRRPED